MPYVDYLKHHLGLDRENLPEEIRQLRQGASIILELSWDFNEIVCYSAGKEFNGNSMRAFYHQPTVHTEICQELRKLIILYGGGEQK